MPRSELSTNAAPPPPKMELVCALCRYAIICREPPERCPMCGTDAAWAEPAHAR